MTITQLVKHYGSLYAVANVLGISRQVLTRWKKDNKVPILQQYRLEILTEGKLTVRDDKLKILINKQKGKQHE